MTEPHRDKPHDQPARGGRRATRPSSQTAEKPADQVTVRTERYLVAPAIRPVFPSAAESAGARVAGRLSEDPEIQVVRTIRATTDPARADGVPVIVVEMAPERAARLAASPDLLVEPDHPLHYGAAAMPVIDPGVAPQAEAAAVTLRVTNEEGTPIEEAAVHVISELPHDRAITDRNGTAKIMLTAAELDSIAGIYVRPRSDHWSAWLARPRLSGTSVNPIVCTTLDPTTAEATWSRTTMGFDRLPPTFRGHGVRLAIVDSGLAMTHTDVADRVASGLDLVTQDEKAWQSDVIGSGTAVAGIIAATEEASRIVGLAPEVDLHMCKVSPGGRVGDLVEAIDHCIAQEVDIITFGPGTPYASWLVAQKIEEARQAGIACIAGTGNTPGPIAFPARLPTVLAVGAIGRLGTFPPDSYHATQLTGMPAADGYFPARLSASGPEVDVCAPGVAVTTTASPSGIGTVDGTAIAAAHVAALAALVLAHHPDFRSGFLARGPARVERLFAIIQTSCRPLPHIDPMRVGAGLPDAVMAVGLTPYVTPPGVYPWAQPPAAPWTWQSAVPQHLPLLRAAMRSAGLAPIDGR